MDETGRVSIYNNTTAVVCIVGRLYAAETKANCTYYSIHDGTGSITARHWSFDSDSTSSSLCAPSLRIRHSVNHYVKVLGVAKKYKTDISINVQHIAPVSSFNTITSSPCSVSPDCIFSSSFFNSSIVLSLSSIRRS